MRSLLANLIELVLPYGATTGVRIELDGITGEVRFYDAAGTLVGFLSPGGWFVGEDGARRVTFDPIGGVRFRDANDVLVGVLDQTGYTIREADNGLAVVELQRGLLRITDEAGGDDIVLTTSSDPTYQLPRWAAAPENDPGSSYVAPAAGLFGTDDLSVCHAAGWEASYSGSGTWTPPSGYTERLDDIDATTGSTLQVSVATDQPASSGAKTFTNSDSSLQVGIGTQVIVEGGGASSPAYRSMTDTFEVIGSATTAQLSLAKPSGVAAGDVLLAFVTMGNAGGTIPTGWETPDGWQLIGATYRSRGAGATLSTLAVGVWRKIAGSSEPSTYEVTINFGAGSKVIHAAIVAVQNSRAYEAGPRVKIGNLGLGQLVGYSELASANQDISVSGIPGDFNHLTIVLEGESNTSASAVQDVLMRFNGDTGATSYHWQVIEDGTLGQTLNTNYIKVAEIDGTNAGFAVGGEWSVHDYANPDRARKVQGHGHGLQTANLKNYEDLGWWNNTADAITSVLLRTGSASNPFAAGTRLYVYAW